MLNQRYLIEQQIAKGSDTRVYKAKDCLRSHPVLIKEFMPSAMQNWKRFQLIEREARILAQLNHIEIPNFVDFFTVGQDQEQTLYLVTKWIHGETLAEKLSAGWRASPEELFSLAEMALRLLMYIHAFNPPIVHRDIKPSNLMLSQYNRLFLLDFGGVQEVMNAQGAGGSTLVGTMGYMPPEHLMGRAVPATDLYALGVTLLVCLTGLAPEQIVSQDAKIDFSQKMQTWFDNLLAKDASERYASAEEALLDLDIVRGLQNVNRTIYLPENHRAQIPEIIHSLTLIERSEIDTRLLAGSLLEGRYEISSLLGSGTHSRVYSGKTRPAGQAVIIKELAIETVENWKNIELFEREIAVVSRLKHPRIPKYIDAFQVQEAERLSWYLVTEALDAVPLDEKLASGWRPDDETIWSIGGQVLEILIYLHTQDPILVHRDIKPSNILITNDHSVFLIDFGAVQNRLWAKGGGGSTIIGTFGYMAPEIFSGQASPSSDLYALGATLVNMLSGKHPIEIPLESEGLNFEPFVRCSDFHQTWLKALLVPDPHARLSSAQEALDLLRDAKLQGDYSTHWYQKRLTKHNTKLSKSSGGRRVLPNQVELKALPQFLGQDEFEIKEIAFDSDQRSLYLKGSEQWQILFPDDPTLTQYCSQLLYSEIPYRTLQGLIWTAPLFSLAALIFATPLELTVLNLSLLPVLAGLSSLFFTVLKRRHPMSRSPLQYRDFFPWYSSAKYPEPFPRLMLQSRLSLSEKGLELSYQNKFHKYLSRFTIEWSKIRHLSAAPLEPDFEHWSQISERPLQQLSIELTEPIVIFSGDNSSYQLDTYKAYFSVSESEIMRLVDVLRALKAQYAWQHLRIK